MDAAVLQKTWFKSQESSGLLVAINDMSLVPEILGVIQVVLLPCCTVQPGSSIGQVIIEVAGGVELVDAIRTVLAKVGGPKPAKAGHPCSSSLESLVSRDMEFVPAMHGWD